jgi:hypothetical protein
LPARRTKSVHRRTFKAGDFFGGGDPSREDPRRNKSPMRAEASAGFENSLTRAARQRTGRVSLRHLLSHSGLGKEQRDGRHQRGHTIEEREGLYILEEYGLDKPKSTLIPPIVLPMASSSNDYTRGNIAGLTYCKRQTEKKERRVGRSW